MPFRTAHRSLEGIYQGGPRQDRPTWQGTATSWDPALYLTFDDNRSRPFHDLLARVGAVAPRRVVDLGCGPGHLTGLLADRWPDAAISALDSSAEMVAAARERRHRRRAGRPRRLDAHARDRRGDQQRGAAVGAGAPGGCYRGGSPRCGSRAVVRVAGTGQLRRAVARARSGLLDEPRMARAGPACAAGTRCPSRPSYADLLAGTGADVDVWETTYLHRLTGPDPVLTWISATALRPVRDALDDDSYERFRSELAPRLRAAYPADPSGFTWFPFRRIFAVARTR